MLTAAAFQEIHRPGAPIRAAIPNVPEFDIDFGWYTNQRHRAPNRTPNFEPFETQIFVQLLSETPRVLDIGANVGWYSCIAAAVNKRAVIHAFEPEPLNFSMLGKNAGMNGFHGIRPYALAVGANDGRITLSLSSEQMGDHRIGAIEGRQTIEVGIAALDTVIPPDFVPDLIKLDVQGAELQVFAGASRTFERAGGGLAALVEFEPEALGTVDACHAMVDRVFSFNRPVFVVHPFEGNQLQPLTAKVLHEAVEGCLHPRHRVHGNVVIAPTDGRFEQLRKWIGRDWAQWAH